MSEVSVCKIRGFDIAGGGTREVPATSLQGVPRPKRI